MIRKLHHSVTSTAMANADLKAVGPVKRPKKYS